MNWRFEGNWFPKLVCLVVAVILWLFIMNDQNPLVEGEYNLQVEVQHLDTSLVALHVPETVHVKLRMQRNTMLHLRESDMKGIVDLSDIGPGTYAKIPIQLVVPKEAEVLEKTPSTFSLQVDHLVFKTIQPDVKIVGQPATGFALEVEQTAPAKVTISGPESIVAQVAKALVTIPGDGRKDAFHTIAPVVLLNAHGEQVSTVAVSPTTLSVSVKATRNQMERVVPLEATLEGIPAAGYGVTEVQVIPQQSKLVGSLREIGEARTWKLPPVSIAGAQQDVVARVPVPVPNGGTTEQQIAEVHVRIEPIK